MMLSKDDILGASDLTIEHVNVPEWDGAVYVRTMTAAERDRFESSLLGAEGEATNLRNIRARLCVLTICDADGKRILDDGDLEALGGKSGAALDRIFSVAQRLNGMSGSDIEAMAKN